MPTTAEGRPGEARSQEFNLGLLDTMQVPKDLCHDLLPPRVHISRKLELEGGPNLKPDTGIWDVGISKNVITITPNAPFLGASPIPDNDLQ